jgi:hypothetical protein
MGCLLFIGRAIAVEGRGGGEGGKEKGDGSLGKRSEGSGHISQSHFT